MHIVIPINNVDTNNIFFMEKTKNNILNGGEFYRILYSTKDVTLNGLLLLINFKITNYENYFNKIKCHLDPNKNSKNIELIKQLENNLLSNYFELNKFQKDLQITQQLDSYSIKLINDYEKYNLNNRCYDINVVLKISGVWTNGNKCGVTFRFYSYPSVIKDIVITYNSTAAAHDNIEKNIKLAM